MKRAMFAAMTALVMFSSCENHEEIFFNSPFVSIADENGGTKTTVSKDGNNLITVVYVTLSASAEVFSSPIEIEYEMLVGDGLKEGVDFKVQATTKSPITFTPGIYTMPIRIQWFKNADFDPDKDNSLTITLNGSNLEGMLLGYPGPDSRKKSYIFTKK